MTPIESLTSPPVIGQTYLVPCVQVIPHPHATVKAQSGLWPVTGPAHDDIEHIGFAPRHWHYDVRFLTAAQFAFLRRRNKNVTIFDNVIVEHVHYAMPKLEPPQPVALRCIRRLPAYSPPWWHTALELAYANARVTDCGRCPHRGIPLASVPVVDGVKTCPAHGLAWNAATGALAPGPIIRAILADPESIIHRPEPT
jgi:hypothetical protein